MTSPLLTPNAKICGDLIGFTDSKGRVNYIRKEDMDEETALLHGNPEALTVFNDSMNDFADGRLVDFEL
ncbi:hypothetical protein [Corynebacterium pygosceleis]|uniref:hypothetical protein n=1 Tax=Corynebacterium pygosceleis TaxID=2800406 RepID=UPI002002F931|nr:hypothetical protein [Corynebacterium pygosceleis]MCK7675908.1 hypothetical protein [Corynebacterium pygosceleis]